MQKYAVGNIRKKECGKGSLSLAKLRKRGQPGGVLLLFGAKIHTFAMTKTEIRQ
jgi:hypothetical protein